MKPTIPALLVVFTAMIAIMSAPAANADSARLSAARARSLLTSIAARYSSATSYSSVASVTLQLVHPAAGAAHAGATRFLVTLIAQRPNRMRLHVQAGPAVKPTVDRLFVSNGVTMVFRDAVHGAALPLGHAPSSLTAMIPQLQRYMSVAAQLDPLYFLTHRLLPPWLHITGGMQTGSSVRVFGSSPSRTSRYKTTAGLSVSLPAMYWEWTIDTASRRLMRVAATLQPLARGRRKLLSAPVTSLVEVIAPARVNQPLAASVFALPGHRSPGLHQPQAPSR
ncbi:MAG: hypothetical protein KGJ62_14465 [Armatimonadetes bacterium]|nr:hypothetical protein [Armatimonadota bacterium]MDE2207328.1 hypothetical protein [Armatimonadota bacterium]